MTYLQLVNKVLTRLREDTVDTVNQNAYSALIGEFVNDAKEIVENAWDWSAYYKQISENLNSSSDGTVELTGSNEYTTIESAFLYESGNMSPLIYRDRTWMVEASYEAIALNTRGQPKYWTVNRLKSGELQILTYPRPDDSYVLVFNVYDRPNELSADTDTLSVPSKPVIMFATALAIAERGEAGGQSASEFLVLADKTLSDAIAVDANRAPEKLLYTAV